MPATGSPAVLGPQEQQLAVGSGRMGEPAQERPAGAVIPDLPAIGFVAVQQPVDRGRTAAAPHVQRVPLRPAQRVAPVGRKPSAQGLAAASEFEPDRAISRHDGSARVGHCGLGRPDQSCTREMPPDTGEQHRLQRGPRGRLEPHRAAQQERRAQHTKRPPHGDLRAGHGLAIGCPQGQPVHRHPAGAQRLAIAPALVQRGARAAEQQLPSWKAGLMPVEPCLRHQVRPCMVADALR